LRERFESPRPQHTNAALAADALQRALATAGMQSRELSYSSHTPRRRASSIPPNVGRIAELLEYDGPFMELRQACTGFANALIVARGLIAAQPSAVIAIVGSETGSVFFRSAAAAAEDGQLINMMQMGDGAAACIVAKNTPAYTADFAFVFRTNRPQSSRGIQACRRRFDAPLPAKGSLEFEHDYGQVRESGPDLFRCGAKAARELGC